MAGDGSGKVGGASPPVGPAGPLIEYPVDYPVKVIGIAAEDLVAHVRSVLAGAAPGVAVGEASTRPSSGGRYLSVTVTVRLHSEDERLAVHAALQADARVLYSRCPSASPPTGKGTGRSKDISTWSASKSRRPGCWNSPLKICRACSTSDGTGTRVKTRRLIAPARRPANGKARSL